MSDVPGFSTVEIEVSTRCNRACSYCPVSILQSPGPQRWMEDRVYTRIISELERLEYRGFLSFHFYNEPLLRKDLEDLVRHARSRLPDAYQLLYTNGDLLTQSRYESLIAAGTDHLFVTQHDDLEFPERPHQTVVMGSDLTLTNRGGLMKNVEALERSLSAPCHAPTDNLVFTFDGDVLLCCDDAARRNVMGNIMTSSIEEIWFAPRFQELRDLLARGRRMEAAGTCAGCSNMEYVQQGENYCSYLRDEARS